MGNGGFLMLVFSYLMPYSLILRVGMRKILPLSMGQIEMMALVASLLLSFSEESQAHSDPWGDIHPQVSVVDGKFSIVFNTQIPEQSDDYSEEKPVYRMIFNPDGTLFAPRHPLEKKRAWNEGGPVGLYGRGVRLGDDTVIFQGNQSAKPGYVLQSPDGKSTQVHLPWPKDVSLTLFKDALVTPEGVAITGKQGDRKSDGGTLFFYWFAHEETDAGNVVNIGDTANIYDFPVASNISFAGGRFWLAYMGSKREGDLKLMLWSWKPGEKDGRVEALDSPADWNSHLSLAAIGDRLCLAYHCVVPESGKNPRIARIVTVFRKAE